MVETRQFTCIGCPIGCPLRLEHEGKKIKEISGNECNRGAKYARQEFIEPRRDLSTTVKISGARWERLPVRVTRPILKDQVLAAAQKIHELQIDAPVRLGQILIKDVLGQKGIHVVATRSMESVNP